MSRLRPTITVSLILLTILSLVINVVLIVVLILNVYGKDNDVDNVDKDIPSSIRPTGCVVGTFTAVYQRQGVNVTIDKVFLCGDNLHYRFTNEAGLRVYNEKKRGE